MNLQDLVKEALKYFTQSTRNDGTKFYHTKDDTPTWVDDMCQTAHGQVLPDDYKYSLIVESLQSIRDGSEDDQYIEPDTYSMDRLEWLASDLRRTQYVDQAIEDFGLDSSIGIIELIGWGQLIEKQEIFNSVLSSLQDRIDYLEDEAV